MHLTVRGTPYLYYGEEIGMRDTRYRRSELQDPVGKRYWPFNKGRDGCRSPMQWDASLNAGFSSVQPWLRTNPDYPLRNVQAQSEDPHSLYHFYKQLIQLRRENPALYTGALDLLPLENESVLVYKRTAAEQQALIALNFSNREQKVSIPLAAVNGSKTENQAWQLLFGGNDAVQSALTENHVQLPAYGLAILIA
jgi:alpha-glucosidase